jgi:hypothetical protein
MIIQVLICFAGSHLHKGIYDRKRRYKIRGSLFIGYGVHYQEAQIDARAMKYLGVIKCLAAMRINIGSCTLPLCQDSCRLT